MKKTFIALFILVAILSTIFTGCITFVNPEDETTEDTTPPTIDETDDTGFIPSPELNGNSSYDCYITVD